MTISSDQYEAVIEHLYRMLKFSVENPRIIGNAEELHDWLVMTANERDNSGDAQAARLLQWLAARAKYPSKTSILHHQKKLHQDHRK